MLLCCLLAPVFAKAGAQPTKLSVENKTGVVAVDTQQPVFGWNITADTRGFKQAAWQLQVASDLQLLKADKADVWDSKKVPGDAQHFICIKSVKCLSLAGSDLVGRWLRI
jgi:alpha-L-rhamnosidase